MGGGIASGNSEVWDVFLPQPGLNPFVDVLPKFIWVEVSLAVIQTSEFVKLLDWNNTQQYPTPDTTQKKLRMFKTKKKRKLGFDVMRDSVYWFLL